MLRSIAALPGPTAIGYPDACLSGGADFICNVRKASEKDRRSYWPPIKTSRALPEVALSSLSFFLRGWSRRIYGDATQWLSSGASLCRTTGGCCGHPVGRRFIFVNRAPIPSGEFGLVHGFSEFTTLSTWAFEEMLLFKFHMNERVFSRATL